MNIRTPSMTYSAPFKIASLAAAAFALASCDQSSQPSAPVVYEEEIVVEPEAPAAESQAAPAVAEAQTDVVPNEALPPHARTSEESVQPDSETLFY